MGFFKNMITAIGIGAAGAGAVNAETPKGIDDLLKDETKIEAPKLEIKRANVVMPGEKTDEEVRAEYEAENARIKAHNQAVREQMAKGANYEIKNVREEIAKMQKADKDSSSSSVAMNK